MADEEQDRSEGLPERRNPWRQPGTIISLASLGVMLMTALWTAAKTSAAGEAAVKNVATIQQQLSGIDVKLNAIDKAVSVTDAERRKDIDQIRNEVTALKGRFEQQEKDQNAFNFNLSTRLATAEAIHNQSGGKK